MSTFKNMFSSSQLKKYLTTQDSLGDALYNCNDENIILACQEDIDVFIDTLGTEFTKVVHDGELCWTTDTGTIVTHEYALKNLTPIFN